MQKLLVFACRNPLGFMAYGDFSGQVSGLKANSSPSLQIKAKVAIEGPSRFSRVMFRAATSSGRHALSSRSIP
jgi:hypothetical protein